jgi:putative DNA primase/helicase
MTPDAEVWDVEQIGAVVPPEDATTSKPFRLPERIKRGDRHESIRTLLRSQQARGISFKAATAACDIENRDRCDPPLDAAELEYRRWWNQPDQPGFDDKRRVELICASEVTVVKMDWLWPARLARGAITLVEGPPEKGKSTVVVDLGARVTRGHSFPGETATREPGNVVMLIAEDDIAATVVPRLIAAGADLKRVFFLSVTRDARGDVVPFHLSDDCERLRLKCQEIGDVALVIVDPLVSFMGSRTGRTLNTYNDMEVRKALAPLKELAEQLRVAVAAIRHYRKGSGTDAMEAGGGSVAFAALVRVIIATLPDPEDGSRYLLAVAKNNLVKKSKRPALAYTIVPAATDPDIGCIAWGRTVERSANEILAAQVEADKNNSGKVAEAKQFLETFLAAGVWVATVEILRAADAHGIKKSAVERAKAGLSLTVEKRRGQWGWMLIKPDI